MQVTRSAYATKKEAQAALLEVQKRQQLGIQEQGTPTVAAYMDGWLANKRGLRDSTRRNYEAHLRLYVRPFLGNIPLTELRPPHIDALYVSMLSSDNRATAATVHHVHRTLRSALNTALKRRLIAWNPVLHVDLPEAHRSSVEVWTPQHVGQFLDKIADHRMYALFHLIALSGMRRGEALGLHWSDVNLETGTLVVKLQLLHGAGRPTLGPPKTRSGLRVVPLDPGTCVVLKEHQAAQHGERAAWGTAWSDTGLVFTREDGTPLRPDMVTRLFQTLNAAAGVPTIRLHDLRHTHASLALAAGVEMKAVSARLGHSSTAITADLYTHVTSAVAREAADKIASLVPKGQRARSHPVVSERLASELPQDAREEDS